MQDFSAVCVDNPLLTLEMRSIFPSPVHCQVSVGETFAMPIPVESLVWILTQHKPQQHWTIHHHSAYSERLILFNVAQLVPD